MMFGSGWNGIGSGWNGIGSCHDFGNGFLNSGWGMLIMFGVAALIVAGIVVLAIKITRRRRGDAVLEALKMMLVNGEISEDEYLKRKKILG